CDNDNTRIDAWIDSVVDLDEARAYALEMLGFGDLLMDHIVWRSGMDANLWGHILETVTLDKNEFSHGYPRSFAARAEREAGGKLSAKAYRDDNVNRSTTNYFTKHDVCASANGVTAILVTTRPDLIEEKPRVAILGMGEGHTKVAIEQRSAPLSDQPAV